jgi:dinuclear metal center YbgI/SA1388 family protein
MTPTLKNILDLLEELVPSRLAEEWDNPGLQLGSRFQEIRKVFLSLDPTLRSVKAACRRDAQLLFTHHPLIHKPISSVDTNGYPGEVILEAIKGNISVVSAHTNLDAARGGINDILADLLGLQDVEVLREMDREDGAGLGRIGMLPEPIDLSAVTEMIQQILGSGSLTVCGKAGGRIHRVAVVGGAGGSLAAVASARGADLFLTGDVSHHHALEAEFLGISLIDAGHFATEKTAFRVFGRILREKFVAKGWEVGLEVDEDEIDPFSPAR